MDIFINDERFSDADVEIFAWGRVLTGVKKIMFNEEQTVEGVKVVGNRKDAGFVRGNQKANGSITLLYEEVLGLEISNGVKSILTIPPSPITIIMSKNGGFLKKTLVHCICLKSGTSVEGGSGNALECEIPLYIGDIKIG